MEDLTKTLIENINYSSPWILVVVYIIFIAYSLIKKYLDEKKTRILEELCSCSNDVKTLLKLAEEVFGDCFKDKKL